MVRKKRFLKKKAGKKRPIKNVRETLTICSKNCMMYIVLALRGVAQLGRALRSGRRGRVFESRRPDEERTVMVLFFSIKIYFSDI